MAASMDAAAYSSWANIICLLFIVKCLFLSCFQIIIGYLYFLFMLFCKDDLQIFCACAMTVNLNLNICKNC